MSVQGTLLHFYHLKVYCFHVRLSHTDCPFLCQSTTVQNTWEMMRQVQSETQGLRQVAAAVACLPRMLEEVQSTGSAVTGFLSRFPHFTLESTRSDLPSVPDITHSSIARRTEINAYANSRDHIQLQGTYNVAHCRPDCHCECHRTSYSWSPWFLARLLGIARIETKCLRSVGPSRHIALCKASSASQIRVTYLVPRWFAMKMIYIRYTSSPLHGPELVIRIPRMVDPANNRGFRAVQTGNLSMFKSAIASGECTPCDVNENGYSLLFASIPVSTL